MKYTIGIITVTLALAVSASMLVNASGWEREHEHEYGEHNEGERHYAWYERFTGSRQADPSPDEVRYRDECGSCHLAYQPMLLSADAWTKIMADLEQHFGDDASLDDQTRESIESYLTSHTASQAPARFRAFYYGASNPDELPRITKTAYFKREHYEIPERFVEGNPKVGGFSQCQKCHLGAEQGDYDEHRIRIPGGGAWDD